MLDMVKKRFWVVLPYTAVCHQTHLKLTPAGVVPQRTRRPRPIMDYTFSEVNQASIQLANPQAMQFGATIHRLLHHIAYANPSHEPVWLSKFNLSDGYYRIPLNPQAALELAVALPPLDDNVPVVGIPLLLPMGWRHSPPFFCSFTETIADIANSHLTADEASIAVLPDHPLTDLLASYPCQKEPLHPHAIHPPANHWAPSPVSFVDVYMDDFLGLAQALTAHRTQQAILHSIDKVFWSDRHPDNPPNRKGIVSRSKLDQGDGTWSTTKTMLGWSINTANKTLQLPPHKAD
jgi:hypothetical protein